MHLKNYNLIIDFPESYVKVNKWLDNDKDAKFWAQLCLDICGKDEQGRKYVRATLKGLKGSNVEYYGTKV